MSGTELRNFGAGVLAAAREKTELSSTVGSASQTSIGRENYEGFRARVEQKQKK